VSDILDDLEDLYKQATTERSHNYVASCTQRAIAEIRKLRGALDTCRELRDYDRAEILNLKKGKRE